MEKIDKLNLPVTRKAHFKDSIKNRWRLLLRCGLVLLLFSLPLVVCSFYKDFLSTKEQTTDYIMGLEVIYTGVVLFNSIIFSVGLSGILKIIKKICWSEGVFFWSDFKAGIKENIKVTLSMCLLLGLSLSLFRLSIIFNFNVVIIFLILILTLFIIFPFGILAMVYSSIYVLSFKQLIHNSSLLFVRNYLFLVAITLIVSLLNGVDFFPIGIILVRQGLIILFLLGSPFIILGLYEYLMNSFDIDINKNNHPELFRKGLY